MLQGLLIFLALLSVLNPWKLPLLSCLGFAFLLYIVTVKMIPLASPALMKIGLVGKDRLKPWQSSAIPESLGVVTGVIYIFGVVLFTPWTLSIGGLAAYLSGLLSIQSMIMLGFADDLFDLRWRHKFFLPAIAAIPMLIVYGVEHGNTHIAIPPSIVRLINSAEIVHLESSVDLHWFYYIYMAAVAIFATNCINIYAGVNGLEVGQTVIVSGSVLANDLYYLVNFYVWGAVAPNTVRAHLLSVYFVLPLLAVSLALLRFNWFPARVFVGDTFCYFSGMVLAVAGILGHFSKTMLSLILPQVANFIYSMPQLLRIVPCPRHRMPLLDEKTRKLVPSRVEVTKLSPIKQAALRLLGKVGLIQVWESPGKMEVSNMTLINLTLCYLGPLREDQLTLALLILQLVSCIFALVVRHMLGGILFGHDNLEKV